MGFPGTWHDRAFSFRIDEKVNQQGKSIFRIHKTNTMENSDVIMIVDAWLEKAKKEEFKKIQDSLPD